MKCAICQDHYDTLSCRITMSNDSQQHDPQYDMIVCEKCYYKVLEKIILMDPMNKRLNKEEQV